MKIMTILGTRPEIIRLSLIMPLLDRYYDHIIVHTGQNFTDSLNAIFFQDLGLRKPDYFLGVQGETFAEQIGQMIAESEKVMAKERPDRILILGDTNSGLSAIIARRMGIPVFHMEAGNRCFDDRVAEEINRRVIDHCSSILMPYTYRSKENLLREGIPIDKIYVIGNPIYEVITHYADKIKKSTVLSRLKLQPKRYILVTMHRAENVDDRDRLGALLTGLAGIHEKYDLPLICSLHPRTENKMKQFGLATDIPGLGFAAPFGFFDFITLEKEAFCVVSDSGTVQEECAIFKVPNVTIRDVTERPETIECGSNILVGVDPALMVEAVGMVTAEGADWEVPAGYLDRNVSLKVMKILRGCLSS